MNRISPKIEIINYFDDLINRIDMDIEKCLENYKEEQILGRLKCFKTGKKDIKNMEKFYLSYFNSKSNQYQRRDEWPESTKVVDYLNQIRQGTIDELRKAQEETLENYKQNSSLFKSQEISKMKIDEINSELFKEKFYFQLVYKPEDPKYKNPWIFNLYTFVTDFYMSQTEIDLLE